jgi:hypothetical protein
MTSHNTVFTLRGKRPLVCKRNFEEEDSADSPALAKSVGNGASLMPVSFSEYIKRYT